jgi:hypothetical protein
VFLEKTPFLAFEWLGALFVVAPLDGIAHRRHDGELFGGCTIFFLLFSLYSLLAVVMDETK